MDVDIIERGAEIYLGDGWHEPENYGRPYRWARNDAIVLVPAFEPGHYRVVVEAEPGPSMKSDGSRELRVFGRYGQKYVHAPFVAASTFDVDLLSPERTLHELRFVVESTGLGQYLDPRVLDFCVFRIAVEKVA
jgi:hypothetical protein